MPVFSKEDLEFWEENGYVVVREAVPLENCRAAEQAVWDFLEMDGDNPDSWYPTDPPRRGIMVEIYQHQALWDNRQYPRVHQAFSEIWDNEKLWVSFDRASMNPPERDDWKFQGPYLHWDMNLNDMPVRLRVQGVLYLADTPGNQGAFTCIPGFHRKLEEWLKSLPEDANPGQVVREHQDEAVPVAGKAGDLVIWHSALPHGSSPNSAVRPRMAQYITMSPAPNDGKDTSEGRVTGWRERLTGLGKNQKEKEHNEGKTAELTPLGKKLLGLDPWVA
ncbi:MAG: phytanoyl-CoA dioxygenase family protein [Candidatus Poribacteria bacterium]|nr:phytanoyl-CoA dioxygenase family protein [Candidatus Poribacteria bacterium]